MKIRIAIFIIIIIFISSLFLIIFDKPSIHEATYEELIDIYGLDNTLANKVLSYLSYNKKASIDDLVYINGIGKGRIKLIKEVYE